MEEFKVGDIVEVIRATFTDVSHGVRNGDIGEIKTVYSSLEIYDVYFSKIGKILAMTEAQLKKCEDPSPDNPQAIINPEIHGKKFNDMFYNMEKFNNSVSDLLENLNEKEKKYMRILDLYKLRKLEEINTAKENKLKEIKSFDSIHSLLDDTEEQLNALLGREENNKVTIEVKNLNGQPLYDDIAENKIKQVFDEYNKKLHDLDKVTEEASALLELTSDYEEQIKILKKYDILDKGGKLNV